MARARLARAIARGNDGSVVVHEWRCLMDRKRDSNPGPSFLIRSLPQFKSSQGLLFSEARIPCAEAVGQTGAQGPVRGCGPHCPPVSRKNPARDEASVAPRAGRGRASFSGLISGVRVLSPALSGSAARVQGGGNPISIDQRPKPRKEE